MTDLGLALDILWGASCLLLALVVATAIGLRDARDGLLRWWRRNPLGVVLAVWALCLVFTFIILSVAA